MSVPTLNAMTVDVEEHFQVAAFKNDVDRKDWERENSRVVANTHRILDLLAESDVRGTFFVLGWVAERCPELVRDIVTAGHELACHGHAHELVYEQDPETFRRETVTAKTALEDAAGVSVAGYRAASYSITGKSMWALDVIAEAGFTYDSSIVPARHDFYGLPGAPSEPYRLRLGSGLELVEFPPTTVSVLGRRTPVGGGGYFRLLPYWVTRYALQKVNDSGRPFSFYTHPWEVDPAQPRIESNFKSRFRHYHNLEKTEPRMRKLIGDFRFTTMAGVLDGLDLPRIDVAELKDRAA